MLSRRKWLHHSLATVVGTALMAPAELRAWQRLVSPLDYLDIEQGEGEDDSD